MVGIDCLNLITGAIVQCAWNPRLIADSDEVWNSRLIAEVILYRTDEKDLKAN